MAQAGVISAVDVLLRRIMNIDIPFGGNIIVGIGDFRQVGPVVPNGGLTACFMASILSLPIWPLFRVHRLTAPIRNAGDPAFADFVDSVGEDTSHRRINLRPWLTHTADFDATFSFIFPDNVLADPEQCVKRAFLTPLNVDVSDFNAQILDRLPGPLSTFNTQIFP